MLSLGIACKQSLLSLTRICENGKWKMENYSSPKLGEVVCNTGGVCRRSTVDVKNAKCEGNFVPSKKASPQFALANEELAYRSAVQNSPAICVF